MHNHLCFSPFDSVCCLQVASRFRRSALSARSLLTQSCTTLALVGITCACTRNPSLSHALALHFEAIPLPIHQVHTNYIAAFRSLPSCSTHFCCYCSLSCTSM